MGLHPAAWSTESHPPRQAVSFTPAEERVLPLLATYMTLEGIAERLGVRRSTIKTHVVSIYKKLGVTCRAQAVEQVEHRRSASAGVVGRPPR